MNDTTDGAATDPRRPALPWIVLPAALAVVFFGCLGAQVFSPDPLVLGSTARLLLDGAGLYSGAWQDKGPLAILAYCVPEAIAPGRLGAQQIWLALCLLVQGLAAARVTRTGSGWWLCFALPLVLPLGHPDLTWASTEHFANLFAVPVAAVAAAALTGRRTSRATWILLGAGVALTFNTRQNASFVGALVVIAALWAPDDTASAKWKRILYVVAGGLLAQVGIVVLVAALGDIRMYFATVWLYPVRYVQAGGLNSLLNVILATGSTIYPWLSAALLFAVWRTRMFAVGFLILAIGWAASLSPGWGSLHYVSTVLPSLVALVVLAEDRRKVPDRALATLLVAALAAGAVTGTSQLVSTFESPSARWLDQVVDAVQQADPGGRRMWVLAPKAVSSYLYFASGRDPGLNGVASYQLDPPWVSNLPFDATELERSVVADPPSVMVIDPERMRVIDKMPAEEPSRESAAGRVTSALLERYHYRRIGESYGLVVLVLERAERRD